MLAKLTSKNQLTLPKRLTDALGPVEYFEVEARAGQLVLTPVRVQRADAVRAKLEALGLDATDLQAAVTWARTPSLMVAEPAPPTYAAAPSVPTRDTTSDTTHHTTTRRAARKTR